jgi:tRNA threonylcarbamoyladenosine biosynthesis protein TsaE
MKLKNAIVSVVKNTDYKCYNYLIMIIEVKNVDEMIALGQVIGRSIGGGEIIELVGDVGSGKTTLVKGIALGLAIDEYIQSPSFTINRVYSGRDNIVLSHYDFYRLDDAGIMANELQEVIGDSGTVTVIEWAGVIKGVLPKDRLSIHINALTDDSRQIIISSNGGVSRKLEDKIKK